VPTLWPEQILHVRLCQGRIQCFETKESLYRCEPSSSLLQTQILVAESRTLDLKITRWPNLQNRRISPCICCMLIRLTRFVSTSKKRGQWIVIPKKDDDPASVWNISNGWKADTISAICCSLRNSSNLKKKNKGKMKVKLWLSLGNSNMYLILAHNRIV
jgi:hypothetical protein